MSKRGDVIFFQVYLSGVSSCGYCEVRYTCRLDIHAGILDADLF